MPRTEAEDAYAGLKWIVEHADELNVDPARIIVMGTSGGGGIAAALCLYARDQGGPAVAHQILIYPLLDDRMENPSSTPWRRTRSSTTTSGSAHKDFRFS
jgi:acetyl esterase/lipase